MKKGEAERMYNAALEDRAEANIHYLKMCMSIIKRIIQYQMCGGVNKSIKQLRVYECHHANWSTVVREFNEGGITLTKTKKGDETWIHWKT